MAIKTRIIANLWSINVDYIPAQENDSLITIDNKNKDVMSATEIDAHLN